MITDVAWHRTVIPSRRDLEAVFVDDRATYVGGLEGLFVRPHGGSWSGVPMRGSSNFVVAIHGSGSEVFAATSKGTVYSTADGVRWTGRRIGFGSTDRPEGVVAFGGGRVLCIERRKYGAWSTDAGESWEIFERSRDLELKRPCAVGTRVYAVLSGIRQAGVAYSDDFGRTWVEVDPPPAASELYLCDMWASEKRVFVVAGRNVLAFDLNESRWDVLFEADDDVDTIGGSGSFVVVSTDGGAIFESHDAGATWKEANGQSSDNRLFLACTGDLAIAVGDDGMVLERGNREVAVSPADAARAIKTRLVKPQKVLSGWDDAEVVLATATIGEDASAVLDLAWIDADTLVEARQSGHVQVWTRADGRWEARELRPTGAAPLVALAATRGAVWGLTEQPAELLRLDLAGDVAWVVPLPEPCHWLAARGTKLFVAAERAIYAVAEGESLRRIASVDGVTDFDVSLDASAVMVGRAHGHTLDVLDLEGNRVGGFSRSGNRVRLSGGFTEDVGQLLVVDADNYSITAVNPVKCTGRQWLESQARGQRLFFGGADRGAVAVLDGDGQVQIFAASSREPIAAFHPNSNASLGGSPREPRGESRVFSKHKIITRPDTLAVSAVALSPEATRLAVGDLDGELCVADTATLSIQQLVDGISNTLQSDVSRLLWPRSARVAGAGLGTDGMAWVAMIDIKNTLVTSRVDDGETWSRTVRTAPREVTELAIHGPLLLMRTPDDTIAFDLTSGEPIWAAAVHVGNLAPLGDGWLYGFERRMGYVSGARVGHRLFRLELATGTYEQVELPVPPGAADNDGYLSSLTPVDGRLLVGFDQGDDEYSAWLWDPATGAMGRVAHAHESDAPVIHLSDLSGEPLGDGLAFFDEKGGWSVRDFRRTNPLRAAYVPGDEPDHTWVHTKRGSLTGNRVVGFDAGANCLHVWSLDEARTVGRLKGLVRFPWVLQLGANGRTAITVEREGAMRRWTLP